MALKTRAELGRFFRTNAIPTESNFSELIEGTLNQLDDRIRRRPGEPVSIAAEGGTASAQEVLKLYGSFDQDVEWTLSLNPRADPEDFPAGPGNPATRGLNIANELGNILYIDMASGSVGVGTVRPSFQHRLHVRGPVRISSGELRIDAGGAIRFGDNGEISSFANNHRILFRRNENKLELREIGDIVLSSGATDGNETARVVVKASGDLGVGTSTPQARLHVVGGDVRIEAERRIRFQDNGEIGSFDDNHRIIFRRTENRMELREFGEIFFSPGATSASVPPLVSMRANGDVTIGTTERNGRLHVVGTIHVEGLIEQANWQTPGASDLAPGWTLRIPPPPRNPPVHDHLAGTRPVGFFKDRQGIVHLRGVAMRSAAREDGELDLLFTLPVGHRPDGTQRRIALSFDPALASPERIEGRSLVMCVIHGSGSVKISQPFGGIGRVGTGGTWVSLDGISFRAA